MADLIYTPGISVIIDSAYYGIIDVSDDIVDANLSLNENRPHSFRVTLSNTRRKYDSSFAPGDRISVRMKRVQWVQVFSGYLTVTPYFSAFPKPVTLEAECTLRNLKNFLWDSASVKSMDFINQIINEDPQNEANIPKVVKELMHRVAGWKRDKTHIGKIPEDWAKKFDRIYASLAEAADARGASRSIGTGGDIGDTTAGNVPSLFTDNAILNDNLVWSNSDMDIVLSTIRYLESRGDYTAQARSASASGAYQFVDSTWNNYGGYVHAKDAPPSVQDEKARQHILDIVEQRGWTLLAIPYTWYYPAVFRDASWLDKVPYPEGNSLTVREYGARWIEQYKKEYKEATGRNVTPPVGETGPNFNRGRGGSTNRASSSGTVNTVSTARGVLYPIPEGVTRLTNATSSWGGFSNGKIPSSALRYSSSGAYDSGAFQVAGEAYELMYEAALAQGLDIQASCYRSFENQQKLYDVNPDFSATPGTSNHGWGLAFDIGELVSRYSTKYNGYDKAQMFQTPEYLWLKQNAYKYGFGHPTWAQEGGSRPEPWHWEFFAFSNYRNGDPPEGTAGVNPFTGLTDEFFGTASGSAYDALQNFFYLQGEAEQEQAELLSGPLALANDEPLLSIIERFLKASGRNFCSAPNGDFIAWFPDYFFEYGVSGAMDVQLIELMDFTVSWSDDTLITHQYVTGVLLNSDIGNTPSGSVYKSLLDTHGVVTIDTAGMLTAIIGDLSGSNFPWMSNPEEILARFGARVSNEKIGTIVGGEQEFWYAVNKFQRAWAGQFTCSAPTTFMPELFPGMALRIPELGVQFYISSVSHSIDMNGGFRTNATLMAPSRIGEGGIFMLPKGGSSDG